MVTDQIDKAMTAMGKNQRYQKLLVILFAVVWFQITYVLLGSSFIFMNPVFICKGDPDPVQENQACPKIDQCHIENSFTLTAHIGLYCDRQNQRDIVQSALFIGSVVGLFVMNMISDIKGRKFGFMMSLVLAQFGVGLSIIGAYSKNVPIIAISQIFCGMGGYSAMIIGYIFLSEICQGKLKSMAIIAMNGFWGIAEMSYCLYYYFLPDWYNYLILIEFIPLFGMIIVCSFFLVETPTFLIVEKQDLKKCMESLKTIGMYNDKGQIQLSTAQYHAEQAIRIIKQNQKQQTGGKRQSPLRLLFCNTVHIRTILLIAVIQVSTNSYYYGIQYSLQNLGFNFGIDILLAGIFQTFAYFSINLFIGKLKRRKGLLITNLASFALGFLFIIPFVSNNKILSSILICLCRMVNTYSQGFIPLLQTQSFPQKIASSGAGMIQGLSQLGSFATPYIVNGVSNLGGNPVVVLSVFVLILGIPPIKFIRQTFVDPKDNKENNQTKSQLTEDLLNQSIQIDKSIPISKTS